MDTRDIGEPYSLNKRTVYLVILRRSGDRYVNSWMKNSFYSAKKLANKLNEDYDPTYSIEIVLRSEG